MALIAGNSILIVTLRSLDLWALFKERQRLSRLKLVSEVEQRYLAFDYFKFFSANEHLKEELKARVLHGR